MDLLNAQEVNEIMEKVFKGDKIQVLSYSIDQKSDKTIGHMGHHLTLTINVSVDGIKSKKILFVKTYNVKDNNEDFIGKTGIFQKEVDVYKVLVEDINNLVGEPKWCPKYYFSKNRALVLEDLSEKGFKMSGKTTLNKEHLLVALRTLSSMHASSLVLEERLSKPLNIQYPNILKERMYDENKLDTPSSKWVKWQTLDLTIAIDYLKNYTKEEKEIIKDRFPDQIKRIYPLSKPSQKYRNVFTHGDLWRNNLMFRYSDNTPNDCVFVDYQFSRYAPPAHDVMHLLHYATKKSTRDEEELNLLKCYYENLKRHLKAWNRDVEKDLTWDDFVASCKYYKELALVQSLLSLHYLLGPANLKVDIETYQKYEDFLNEKREEYMRTFFKIDWYADKITDMLYELIDTYIIKK